MNAQSQSIFFRTPSLFLLAAAVAMVSAGSRYAHADYGRKGTTVRVNLSEWKVQVAPARVPPGPVTFEVSNTGTIPHALEVEGRGSEKSTAQIKPGTTTTLKLDLGAGSYEVYCPVGKGSHEMLGMKSQLTVGEVKPAPAPRAMDKATGNESGRMERAMEEHMGDHMGGHMGGDDHEHGERYAGGQPDDDDDRSAKAMKIRGGGTVIQILPGPFPFADSASAVIQERPADQQADLTKKAHLGPYSNNVAKIAGDISLLAIDRGAAGDSVSGTAEFTAQDGARWKVVMDRVQTKDIPFNPRFGGVVMGLFYHGASGVHTPLVPTIQSSLALWAVAHLYKNDRLVTDSAMVHVMLLSRTRRPNDWALDCWDCSGRPVEELQLQVTSAPGAPAFEAPGGFLFVNWERSSGQLASL